jgi:hypothetical protein
VTENLPAQTFSSKALNLPQSLQLADPHFNVSGPIDMLMGAQLFWQILNKGQISLGHNKPVLQQTHFGWIIGGALNISPEQNHQSTYSREEGNEWEKDRRNKIPNVKIRQTIAQESVWKALLPLFLYRALSLLRSG